jgi:hypothetical protein
MYEAVPVFPHNTNENYVRKKLEAGHVWGMRGTVQKIIYVLIACLKSWRL